MNAPTKGLAGEIEAVYQALTPLRLRSCPLVPTAKQEAFLRLPNREVFFGGGAAGGKTTALLAAALQYVDVPGYHALLLRRTLIELHLPGGLIYLSHEWLAHTKAQWIGELKQWRFPSGATLTFGYLDNDTDVGRYFGTSFSFLGWDELTSFPEAHYLRLFRVLRQPAGNPTPTAADGTRLTDVPPRVRSTSNPGGQFHTWVKTRFVDPQSRAPGVVYIPARLTDNPHLDQTAYMKTLENMPRAERERLLNGDWAIPDDGELFRREWFEIIEPHQLPEKTRAVRFWDLASTAPNPVNPDPDYTCGLRLETSDAPGERGIFYITEITLARQPPGTIEHLVAQTAEHDGRQVTIVIEQEPGAAGVSLAERYKRDILRGYTVYTRRPTGSKIIRAHPVAAAAENGYVKLIRGRNTLQFLDQITSFPHGHDDCVDALAGAHGHLARTHGGPMRISSPVSYRIDVGPRRSPLGFWTQPADIDQLAAMLGVPVYDSRHRIW